ncbi:MAG: DUF3108 domain-containing protein, partial [Nitrospinota bacterium]
MRVRGRRQRAHVWWGSWALAVAATLLVTPLAGAADKLSHPGAQADQVADAADSLPFGPGEELTYRLTWWGLPAGTAVTRITETTEHNGHRVWRITSTATSSEFVDLFYKVRDRVVSLFDPALRAPRYYKIDQREGRYRARRVITFDQEAGR